MYSALELESTMSFPDSVIWNSWAPPKVFHLGGFLGKSVNFGSSKEEIVVFGKQMSPLSSRDKESIDHILIHCVKRRVLWIFCSPIQCVLGASMLSQRDSFRMTWFLCGKKSRKRRGRQLHCLFWTIWKEKKQKIFWEWGTVHSTTKTLLSLYYMGLI